VPHVEHFRKLARRLQRAVRAGDARALELVRRHHPGPPPAEGFPLSAAQLVVAREAGFPSWPRMRAQLDRLGPLRRDPGDAPAAADPADELCRLACLAYAGDDGPDRWTAAAALLSPEVVASSVWAAAAASDRDAVAAHLARDPALAGREGGPHDWPPLLYLAYSRLPATRERTAGTATLLLDAGADPDAGYLWQGLPTPFTALTGAFGEGESGPRRQPPHPRATALATVLLDAGADPNDGQALYNRMFTPGDDWLELLFRYGLGRVPSVWQERLGGAGPTPAESIQRTFTWAAAHGFADRVRLMLDNGVDPAAVSREGSAVRLAAVSGHREIVAMLVAAGAPATEVTGTEALAQAVLAGDEAGVDPALLPAARAAHPDLVARAARTHRVAAVELAVRLGFPLDPGGPSTALHEAAWDGDLEVARALVRLGADPSRRDAEHHGRPLDWARHGYQDAVAAFLETVTPEEGPVPGGPGPG
jgi:Ankyrin repeat